MADGTKAIRIMASVMLVQDDKGDVYEVEASAELGMHLLKVINMHNGGTLPLVGPKRGMMITPNESEGGIPLLN
jgi:hypothetical protein